jgi:hypothetical protein
MSIMAVELTGPFGGGPARYANAAWRSGGGGGVRGRHSQKPIAGEKPIAAIHRRREFKAAAGAARPAPT